MGLGTKKRWRIGGRNKSKAGKEDTGTAPATPESSDASGSLSSGEENNDTRLPAPMSDVDDDSEHDDDLYLDNDNHFDDIKNLPKPPPLAAYQEGDNNDDYDNSPTKHFNEDTNNLSNIDQYSDDEEDTSSFEEDMERHRMERSKSQLFSEGLHKIEEESHHTDDEGDDDKYNKSQSGGKGFPQNMPAGKSLQTSKPMNHVPPTSIKAEIYTNENGEIIELPSPRQLSKELGKIVATQHFSGAESLRALEKLSEWARTQDSTLLKHFLTYGGVVKVVDFLREQIEDPGIEGEFLMESIQKACDVICNVCYVGKYGINEDIAVVNATVVVKYEGIETLLLASHEYNETNKESSLALKASEGVWNAIMNVYCNAEAAITKTISMLVLDAGIEMMGLVGSVDDSIAVETLANVFNTFYRITYHGYVTNEEFQKKDILSHCLKVFTRDVTCSEGDEELLEEAISFFYGCHEKALFTKSSDYERVLPLCVMGLREFAQDNDNIREWATKLLDGACSNVQNKESIMMAEGAIEALAPFLTSKDVGAAEKDELRKLIRKIVAA